MMIEEPKKQSINAQTKRKPKEKEKILISRNLKQNNPNAPKERGGGREKPKEATEWLKALARYRYTTMYECYQEMVEQLSDMKDERSDGAR